tara:strand:+ start:471 stop:680 length:210 start_codon:yes stop_codon:yes gene_type:complete
MIYEDPFLILFLIVFILFIIAGILGFLGWFIGNKQKQIKEKLNPFECGFDNNPSYRFPLLKKLNNNRLY